MAETTFSCPFCNHGFAAEQVPRTCPRCGEFLRTAAGFETTETPASSIDLGKRVKRSLKHAMLASLLIILAVVAAAVWKLRQEKPNNFVPNLPPNQPSTPLELSGLQYLPPRCNVVFAVQPGPLLVYAERTKQDPVELLTRNRVPVSIIGALGKAGVTLQQVDHVVGGVYVPDKNEELHVGFVLVLRQKVADEKAFLEALKAVPAPNLGQGRFIVQVGNFALHAFHAAETVWVFGLREKDIATDSALAPAMWEVIVQQVPKDSAIWGAAAGEKWHEKPLALFLGKETLGPLSKGRAAAFGYSFGERPTLHLAVRTTDHGNAEKLRGQFKGLATGEASFAGGTDDWATLSRTVEPADVYATVKRLLE